MVYYLPTSQLNTARAKKARVSQYALSLFQRFFQLPSSLGTKPARYLVTGSLFGWLVTPSIAFSGTIASGFCYLTKWTGRKSAYDTLTPLAHNERDTFTVASQNIPPTPLDGQDLDHLSEAELSQLLDLLLSQVEHHRDELARLKPILHRLQARIPNQPFLNFINELEF